MALSVLKVRAKPKPLLVRARGDALVPDHEAAQAPRRLRAFVGRVFDKSLAIPGESEGGWRPTLDPQEVSPVAEYQYLLSIVHGDLWPADQQTADRASELARAKGLPPIKFDDTFGGELAELKEWLDAQAAEKADAEALAKANAKTTDKPGPKPGEGKA